MSTLTARERAIIRLNDGDDFPSVGAALGVPELVVQMLAEEFGYPRPDWLARIRDAAEYISEQSPSSSLHRHAGPMPQHPATVLPSMEPTSPTLGDLTADEDGEPYPDAPEDVGLWDGGPLTVEQAARALACERAAALLRGSTTAPFSGARMPVDQKNVLMVAHYILTGVEL